MKKIWLVLIHAIALSTLPRLLVAQCTLGGYCQTSGISAFSISKTTLNNKNTYCDNLTDFAYSAYPASGNTTATLVKTLTYAFNVTTGSYSYSAIAIWIDFDHDSIYESSEWYLVTASVHYDQETSVNITIPATAVPGPTRIRVRSRYDFFSINSSDACTMFTNGSTQDYVVNILAAVACTGTPDPGLTISSANPVCSGVVFGLNLQKSIYDTGISYQWQKSADSLIWMDVPGAKEAAVPNTQTDSTYYRCLAICTSWPDTAISTPVHVFMKEANHCHCIPPPSNNTCFFNFFEVKTSGGVVDFYDKSPCSNSSYSDYSGSVTASNVQLSVTTMTLYSLSNYQAFSVWIDYNDNGIFEGSENIISESNQFKLNVLSVNYTVPLAATPGIHRMRVRSERYEEGIPSDPCSKLKYGETKDYSFEVLALVPCSGMPDPGNTLTTSNGVCPGENFTLKVQKSLLLGTGISYQWQSSADSSSWTNIPGAVSTILTTSQTAKTYYRCGAACSNSGLTAYTSAIPITMMPNILCYCHDNMGGDCSWEGIMSFSISGTTLDNPSTYCDNITSANYSVYPDSGATTASLQRTEIYTVNVKTGPGDGSVISLWIDYNQNRIYASNEWYRIALSNPANQMASADISIPAGALPGKTGMRIRSRSTGYSNGATDACSYFGTGCTQDYVITIIDPPPCSGMPDPGKTLSAADSICAGVNFGLTLEKNIAATGILYQWQSSPDSVIWTDIPGAVTKALTISQYSPTYYRCHVTCSNTGMSSNSTSSRRVTMKRIISCYCHPLPGGLCSSSGIASFSISNTPLNNTNTLCDNLTENNYSVYPASGNTTATLQKSASYTFNITNGDGTGSVTSVWIDYDHNSKYDSDECTQVTLSTPAFQTASVTVIIPADAISGPTGMRIRSRSSLYTIDPADACVYFSSGSTQDYIVNIIDPVPCSGMPDPGNTLSTSNPVCRDFLFTLSMQKEIIATGNLYQWQSSTDSISWTNIAGATNVTYTASQNVIQYYHCQVTCTNGSLTSISNPVRVLLKEGVSCQCTPPPSTNPCGKYWISNVKTTKGRTNFNNSTNCSVISYADYTGSIAASNPPGDSIIVTFSSYGGDLSYAVWIDFDDNGSFDVTEKVISDENKGMLLTLSDTFIVPVNAPYGKHKMRVRGEYYLYGGVPTNACSKFFYGETEDYSFIVNCQQPNPIIIVTESFLISSVSSGNQWYFNDKIIDGAKLQFIKAAESGSYYVCATDKDGCESCSDEFVSILTDLKNTYDNENLMVYPNPFSDFIFILPDTDISRHVEIFNLLGYKLADTKTTGCLNVQSLSPGMYVVKVDGCAFKCIKQ